MAMEEEVETPRTLHAFDVVRKDTTPRIAEVLPAIKATNPITTNKAETAATPKIVETEYTTIAITTTKALEEAAAMAAAMAMAMATTTIAMELATTALSMETTGVMTTGTTTVRTPNVSPPDPTTILLSTSMGTPLTRRTSMAGLSYGASIATGGPYPIALGPTLEDALGTVAHAMVMAPRHPVPIIPVCSPIPI